MSSIKWIAAVLVAFVLGAALMWMIARPDRAPTNVDAVAGASTATEREVLYWYDPMVPKQRFDKPGKSPFMDMQLVPKYADEAEAAGDAGIRVDPRLVQNLGVRTSLASLGTLAREVHASGAVEFDERAVSTLAAPVDAIVQRLHVRAPWDRVRAGAPLFTLLAPSWTAAQEEYLSLRRAKSPGLESLADAARQRLLLLGMSQAQIKALERSQRAQPRIVMSAPRSGVLSELLVREGATVMAGSVLGRINSLDQVWINAAIPERDAALISAGSVVHARVPALPGQTFTGTVEQMLATVDAQTRTQTARIVIGNPDQSLVPGMYAELQLVPTGESRQCVLVPVEAVIETGTRQVVVVAESKGRFRTQPVTLGRESGGMREILSGLEAGTRVVISGQFLLDSEASLSATESRMDATTERDASAKSASQTDDAP